MTVIDIHAHYVPQQWPALAGTPPRPTLRVDGPRDATIMLGSQEFRRIDDASWNADKRLEDMDTHGIDLQVMSPTPVFFSYEQHPDAATQVASIFNDLALDIAAQGEGRLLPFCQVPLQDTDAACAELDRCLDAGHVGVEIGNHVGDRDLDDAGIVTFLQHCADRDVPVFIHPWDMPNGPRLDRWMAQWLVGMPSETHLSILALILGGVFDRVGPELRLCFAHGGGSFPFWIGRMDNAWQHRNDIIGTSALPPSGYLDRFSVDTLVFDHAPLRMLIDTMGADRVMLGSDYPYPLGEQNIGELVRTAGLDSSVHDRILGRNAELFLGARSASALQGISAAAGAV
ncbi:amidohydrolase family protein [Microbacterium sp. YY-01]|uniref:amidohydrolase family protein n=1 Tax=Microbacterium sp. YY-01 TaxID=3421634 RepID=UPI003D184449